jgi:hypothetical protein
MQNALIIDLREIILHRVKTAPLRELLDLSESPKLDAFTSQERFECDRFEVDDDIVIDHQTGLTWLRDYVPGGKRSWQESVDSAAALDVRGWKWRAPTIKELLSIVDYERSDPAFNTDVFKGGSDWVWSSTPLKADPGVCAWGVGFSFGLSSWGLHD